MTIYMLYTHNIDNKIIYFKGVTTEGIFRLGIPIFSTNKQKALKYKTKYKKDLLELANLLDCKIMKVI